MSPLDAGYSGTPLVKKLGFLAGDTVYVEDTPDWYSKLCESNEVELSPSLPATHAHLFFSKQAEIEEFLKNIQLEEIEKSLWVSWPKKASGVKTDIKEQTFRDLILPLNWVDTKVAAVDET